MNKKIKIRLVILASIVLLAVFFLIHKKNSITARPAATPVLVKLSAVKVTDIPLIVETTGKLVALYQTDISPKVSDHIAAIHFKEGDFVKQDTALIELDARNEQDSLLNAQAEAKLSQLKYQRYLKLMQKGMGSQQDTEDWSVANQSSQARLQTAQTNLEYRTLRAPFDGYLGASNVNLGDFVSPGQKLVTLVNTEELKIEYTLPSQYANLLQLNQSCDIDTDTMPRQPSHAVVSYIAPFIDSGTQTIAVHALLDNKNNALKPGQFVSISQKLGEKKAVLVIPEDSLFARVNGYYVMQVKDNRVVSKTVVPGQRLVGEVEIVQGLAPGDKIITTGQHQVKEGMPVKVVEEIKSTAKIPL